MPFIVSTLTNSYRYTNWKPQVAPGHPLEVESEVLINGGANLADKRQITPKAVITEVTEDQLDALSKNVTFSKHVEKGFLIILHSKPDAEEVAKDMKPRDQNAPYTPSSPEFQRPDREDASGVITGIKPRKKGK